MHLNTQQNKRVYIYVRGEEASWQPKPYSARRRAIFAHGITPHVSLTIQRLPDIGFFFWHFVNRPLVRNSPRYPFSFFPAPRSSDPLQHHDEFDRSPPRLSELFLSTSTGNDGFVGGTHYNVLHLLYYIYMFVIYKLA